MKANKKLDVNDLLLAVMVILLCLLPLIPVPEDGANEFLAAIGRFHPLVVHFPIALLLVLLLLELAGRTGADAPSNKALHLVRRLALAATGAAILAGFLLYLSGEYQGRLVRQHLWGGVGVGLLYLVAIWFRRKTGGSNGKGRRYLVVLALANILLVYTGHKGGQLTHGVNYLTELWPEILGTAAGADNRPVEELLVYEDVLNPLLDKHCNNCHNSGKAKGGLVLTSLPAILAGGKSGKPMIVPETPGSSELLARVKLPKDHEDYMPPDGKPALPPEAVDLLEWWIGKGAGTELTLGEGMEDPGFADKVTGFLPEVARIRRRQVRDRKEREEIAAKLLPLADRLGLVAAPDPDTDSLYFGISMKLPSEPVHDKTLLKLEPYYHAISKISLVGSEITDEALHTLSLMPNLRRVFLNKTCVTGEGLLFLSQLPQLELLNLSHSDLDDRGVLYLMRFPALEKVFLFHTFVHDQVLEGIRWHLPDTDLLLQEGPYY